MKVKGLIDRALRIEELAKMLHESGRESVQRGWTYVEPSDPNRRLFCEWDALPEPARQGRRSQAAYLIRSKVRVGRLLGLK